jgi:hypothetical protein
MQLMLDLVRALTGGPEWEQHSFPHGPQEVPCGRGIAVSDSVWNALELSKAGVRRPGTLYVSISLSLSDEIGEDGGREATIRAHHDFDCDGQVAISEMVGRYRQNQGFPTGWDPIRTSYASVAE